MHRAAHGLGKHVLAPLVHIRALQAEAGADRIDDARIEAAQIIVAEAHALHHAGAEIAHDHVCGLHQTQCRLSVRFRFQVQGDAALVAVQAGEDRVVAAVRVLAHAPAREVAGADALDLDDVGAVVAQHLGTARPHHHLGKVQNADALQRKRAVAAHACIGGHQAASVTSAFSAGRSPGSAPWARIRFWMPRTSTSRTRMPASRAWAAAMPAASPMAMQGGISRLIF